MLLRADLLNALTRCDRHGANFVPLADLRDALPGYSRADVDAALRAARVAGVLTLSALESARGMSPGQFARLRAAAVCEFGDTLGYVSRTSHSAAPLPVEGDPADSWDDPRWDRDRWTIAA